MDIACTIATTRRLGSTVRVDLDMNQNNSGLHKTLA